MPYLLWHGNTLGILAVTTCLNDLSLSRLGFEHPTFRLRGQRSNPLRHRGGALLREAVTHPRVAILTVKMYYLSEGTQVKLEKNIVPVYFISLLKQALSTVFLKKDDIFMLVILTKWPLNSWRKWIFLICLWCVWKPTWELYWQYYQVESQYIELSFFA